MYDPEAALGPSVIGFVERHVRTLLAWDILVFFHRNPDVALDAEGLAARLGRRVDEVQSEIPSLCAGGVLECDADLIHYHPDEQVAEQVDEFVEACQDRGRRLALIALVLQRIGRGAASQDA